MTGTQVAYQNYKESKRHNQATEVETNRSNVARETETNRHNLVTEQETNRHNVVTERETHRTNVVNESIGWYNAATSRQMVGAAYQQAAAARMNAQASLQNAETNRLNSDRNYEVNSKNATSNRWNAVSNIVGNTIKSAAQKESVRHNKKTEGQRDAEIGINAGLGIWRSINGTIDAFIPG